MQFEKKDALDTARDIEPGSDDRIGEMEEIKRDLKSRHINMIAIAGMIVSVF